MSSEQTHPEHDAVEMPTPTVAPLVLSVGLTLLAVGVVTSPVLLFLGALLLAVALGIWIHQLLPGRGHAHEPLVDPALRPQAIQGMPGTVEQLRPGMPGYRVRLPEHVHPISAGVKGGIAGGLIMPLPALAYGLLSGRGIWYPVNLLAGMVLPGLDEQTEAYLRDFHLGLFVTGFVIHAVMSVVVGLIYGVLLPTLPEIPRPLAWGGLLMPLLWTAVTFLLMGIVNPRLYRGVDWPWFIVSQFVFGVAAALVVMRAEGFSPARAGLLGGIAGGALMPVPALLWSVANGRGLWYPVNLLAGVLVPGIEGRPAEELQGFNAGWFVAAVGIHAAVSAGFGLAYGLMLSKLPPIPAPVVWGGLLLPLLWTAMSYGLMGVVNPVLQRSVDWPEFIVSQFIFGIAAAIVVNRSEQVHIPPAGRGE